MVPVSNYCKGSSINHVKHKTNTRGMLGNQGQQSDMTAHHGGGTTAKEGTECETRIAGDMGQKKGK